MSFRLKTILGIGLIEMALLSFIVWSSLYFLKTSNENELLKRSHSTANLFATTIKDAVLATDLDSLEWFVDEVMKNPGLVYARVTGIGAVLAERGDKEVTVQPFHEDINLDRVTDGVFDVYADIIEADTGFGRVELGFSVKVIHDVLNKARQRIIIIAVLEMTFTALFSFVLGSFLTRKLKGLMEGAHQISEGNLDYRIDASGKDELAQTAQALNYMSKRLKAANHLRDQMDSKRKDAEKALITSQVSLSNAQRIAQMGNIEWDIITGKVYLSDEVYNIFGIKQEEFGNNYEAYKATVHPDDKKLYEKSIDEALYENKPYNIEHRIIRPDGIERIVHKQAEVKFNDTGAPIRMLGTVQDITERKEMEKKILKAQKLDSVGVLAGGIAHELNSPLDGLLTMLRIRKKNVIDDQDEYNKLSIMVDSAEHMVRIIRDFSSFSREPSGKFSKINVNEVIESTLSFSVFHLMKHNVKITKDYADNLSNIQGDKSLLQQVVLNIVTNARDSMLQGGELVIRTRNSETGDKVIAEFIDTGVGIKEKDLPRIFDPFFTTKEQGKGIGLGLSISHGIVKNHNGELLAESPPGGQAIKGAKFTISLPALRTEEE